VNTVIILQILSNMKSLMTWKPNCAAAGDGSSSSRIPGLAFATFLFVCVVVDFLLKLDVIIVKNQVDVFCVPQSLRFPWGSHRRFASTFASQ
jgi:hypothetical protein